MKSLYRWFEPISISLIPACFYCIVTAWIIEAARYQYYSFHQDQRALDYAGISTGLLSTIDSLGLICNIISCTILALVMRLLHQRTKSARLSTDQANSKNSVNKFVTSCHIGVTLAFSITQTLPLFKNSATQVYRMLTAFFFFGGASDLFLSLMLWFILDDYKTPALFIDGDKVYTVANIIKMRESTINSDNGSEEEEDQIIETS